jgi:integrase
VFATANGTTLDAHNVRRSFRRVVAAAGLNPRDWTPRELRHSFVSLLSANGVRIEDISRLVGHSATGVTQQEPRGRPRLAEQRAVSRPMPWSGACSAASSHTRAVAATRAIDRAQHRDRVLAEPVDRP